MAERRSETLGQAVEEYRRRYGRKPPKGFELWWNFVTEHNVLFPDEYDEIERSLGPYRAFTTEDLAQRINKSEGLRETVKIRVYGGGQTQVVYTPGLSADDYWTHRRTDAQENLLKPIAKWLPDFTMIFGLKDEPQFMFDNEVRTQLLDFVARGETVPPTSTLQDPPARFPWPRSCNLQSPLRQGLTESALHTSFVSDHRSAQDPCLHPLIASGHGFLLDQKGEWTSPAPKFFQTVEEVLGPVMCLSKTARNGDVLGVAFDEGDFKSHSEDPVPWEEKKEKLYWRGHATGMHVSSTFYLSLPLLLFSAHSRTTFAHPSPLSFLLSPSHRQKSLNHGISWRLSHRPRLHQALNSNSSLPLVPVLLANPETSKAETRWFEPRELKEWGYDVSLSGGAMQCDRGDGTCREMAAVLKFAKEDLPSEIYNHKYLHDIDGNAWTNRFQRLMYTNSLVLKSTIFPEWNSDILPAWFAYVPIKMDYSDIPSVLAFFRGSPDPSAKDPGRDEVARRIASNGRCWVERTWRREDVTAYVFRLYLEWARIQSGGDDFDYESYVRAGGGKASSI
ncbi:hypothetical protein BDY24DRAFT_184654 [Mrakia frigida]|uniref:uncharacterized protein n=1 Tax=Mrakia frigida TaxID=29902 RepID=UPI003FCC1206